MEMLNGDFVNDENVKSLLTRYEKATAIKDQNTIQTFGSALKGSNFKDGNTNTWYVLEMAEKRAMSRAVLKLAGFYELGVFGEDESESFKRNNN